MVTGFSRYPFFTYALINSKDTAVEISAWLVQPASKPAVSQAFFILAVESRGEGQRRDTDSDTLPSEGLSITIELSESCALPQTLQ